MSDLRGSRSMLAVCATAAIVLVCAAACRDTSPAQPIAQGIRLDPGTLTLTVRSTGRLTPVFDGGPAEPVRFTSSARNIVSVDSAGRLSADWPGTATITVQSLRNPTLTATATVTVTGIAVRVFLDTSIVADGSANEARVKVGGTDDNRVAFSSADPYIVDVAPDGLVCARQVGSTYVRIRSLADTTAVDSTLVRVVQHIGFSLNPLADPAHYSLSLADTTGAPIDTAGVRGVFDVNFGWDVPRCTPPFSMTFLMTPLARQPGPTVRWGGIGHTRFRVDTRVTDASGKRILENGMYWIRVEGLIFDGGVRGSAWLRIWLANP